MDVVIADRLQFAFTVMFHYLFPITTIGLVPFVALYTIFWGKKVGANYWGEGAQTLEWTLPSPPPHHTYETLPEVVED